ncbi:MAG: dephospho-CoA kinase [Vicinamibacteria bacterium]|nr:dephospho-CoA kinase [Vicinamibacteria bacterium]
MATARPPYRVGITGSIASGKSTVARRLKDRGIPVIDLDKVGHEVLRKRHEAFEPVVAAFGEGILGDDGEIDRKKLGAVVFADPAARERLNAIMHPRIRDEEARRIAAMAEAGETAVATEAALLIESGQKQRFDFFVVVGCAPEIQIARLMKRDHCSEEEAKRRIASQLSFEEKKAHADWVIDTSGEKEHTFAETDRLVDEIKRRAAERTS